MEAHPLAAVAKNENLRARADKSDTCRGDHVLDQSALYAVALEMASPGKWSPKFFSTNGYISMLTALDHIIVGVNNLEQATKTFSERLGLIASGGGIHADCRGGKPALTA